MSQDDEYGIEPYAPERDRELRIAAQRPIAQRRIDDPEWRSTSMNPSRDAEIALNAIRTAMEAVDE